MNFDKYKPRLKEYLRRRGVKVDINPTHCFNATAHKHGDSNPSLQLFDDSFKCHGCGVGGDIFDAAGLIEGIADKREQYLFIERFFGDSGADSLLPARSLSEPSKADAFAPDADAQARFEAYLARNAKAAEMIRAFLRQRAQAATGGALSDYPADMLPYLEKQFFYWNGLDLALSEIGRDTLKRAGVPLVNPQKGYSTWGHSGAVLKLRRGYKLHYYADGDCKKINSHGGVAFPMPGAIDADKPVILVEGELKALACRAIGIENVFATGGAQALSRNKVQERLMDTREIILLFDSDASGRKAAGLDPLTAADARKTNTPQTIRKAGYAGKIRVAEIPPACGCKDPEDLILAGKRDVLFKAIADAQEWIPSAEVDKSEREKKYVPLVDFGNLSLRRLNSLLRELPRERLERTDAPLFITACGRAFNFPETREMLLKWGASAKELAAKNSATPDFLLDIAERYLSRYLRRQIEKELASASEPLNFVKINGVKVPLEADRMDAGNENAAGFVRDFTVRAGALLLADLIEDRVVYNDAKNDKKFYFFNGHTWEYLADIAGAIYDTLSTALHSWLKRELDENETGHAKALDGIKDFYMGKLRKLGARRMRVEIQQEFAGLPGVNHNSDSKSDTLRFDDRENIKETITLADGVMDFSGKTLVFRVARPSEFRRETLPYTMAQVAGGTDCEKFRAFMRGNFKNKETLEMFMYYLSLIPSMTQYKYGAFFIGGKNTGKSTMIKLIKGIYGHLVGFIDKDVLAPKGKTFATGNGPTPYIARLPGLGAAIVNESDDGATLNEALWKSLTGNDVMVARGLNEAPKEFMNTAQIIIQTNNMPKFSRRDDAIIERMIVIPFLVQHSRDDENRKEPDDFEEELRPEFPAVIRLLADYYLKLKNELKGVIPVSQESSFYKTDYISELDTDMDKFIAECLIFEEGASEVISRVYEQYKNYHEFTEEAVKRGEALSLHKFSRFFNKNYKNRIVEKVMRVNGKPTRCYCGLRIKPFDPDALGELPVSTTAFDAPAETPLMEAKPKEENPFG
jgi:phage/plasmid-associated DNA primase